jgi:hypothetical protein
LAIYPTWFPSCDIGAWDGDATKPIWPFTRGDVGCDSVPFSASVNACHLGEWPIRGTVQKFELLALMLGVTFTYSGTTITAHKFGHGLKRGSEPFRIYGQTGGNAVLNGSWSVATIPDGNSFTFTIGTAPSAALNPATLDFRDVVDECLQRADGWKGVQSGKAWNGRLNFLVDAANHPEQVRTRWRKYDVTVAYAESYTVDYQDSPDLSFRPGTFSGGWGAVSSRFLTAGGVEDCVGSVSGGLLTETPSNSFPVDFFNIYGPASGDPAIDAAQLAEQNGWAESWCNIDGNVGRISCRLPLPLLWRKIDFDNTNDQGEPTGFYHIDFNGTPADFQALIASWNVGWANTDPVTPGNIRASFAPFITGEMTISSTEIKITFNAATVFSQQIEAAPDAPPNKPTVFTNAVSFSATVKLSDPYTLTQCDEDAKALLSVWDMTNDKIYPWRKDGNCHICPYVSVWEKGNAAPGVGYCDTPANPTQTAIYDGSIRGAPINYYSDGTANYPVGRYNEGWFDFGAQRYTSTLCYQFGFYVNVPGVTMATQSTPGTTDNPPFSRYLNPHANYNLPFPPWINYSGGYAATDTGMVYAGKWAEVKKPLASQNYWGECGAMRAVASYYDTDCSTISSPRYPSAYGICGKMAVASAVQSGGNVNITTAGTVWLKNGDSVDFTGIAGLGSGVTVAGLSGSVAAVSAFTVAGTLTTPYTGGGFVQAHGSPDAVWYDVAPKGYFVRAIKNAGVVTAEEGNVKPTNGHPGIIAIVPPNSPELNSPLWPGASTVVYTDYGRATIPPNGTSYDDAGWYSAITQAMADRFWIHGQDGVKLDPAAPPNVCVKNPDAVIPYVEARLHAPTGAPLQFTADNLPEWLKMPLPTDYGFQCSDAWDMTDSTLGFSLQHGVSTNTADALKTNTTADASDAGWGTADATFIP